MITLTKIKHNEESKYYKWRNEIINDLSIYNSESNKFNRVFSMIVDDEITFEDIEHHIRIFIRDVLECDSKLKENIIFRRRNDLKFPEKLLDDNETLYNKFEIEIHVNFLHELVINIKKGYFIASNDDIYNWPKTISWLKRLIKEDNLLLTGE